MRSVLLLVVVGLCAAGAIEVRAAEKRLTYKQARICVTGYDTNRPDGFAGLGDFIGWAGGLEKLPGGGWLLAHSAGYWHVSFAQPRLIAEPTRKKWKADGWPLEFPAPTGRSVDADALGRPGQELEQASHADRSQAG